MRVRTTIFLLLLLAATAFVAGLLQVKNAEADQLHEVTSAMRRAWAESVQNFWNNQRGDVKKMIEDMPVREGLVGALLDNNQDWAEKTWNGQTLAGSEPFAIWVYRLDGTLFHTYSNAPQDDLAQSPLDPDAVKKLIGRDRPTLFYFRLKSNIPGKLRLVEVRGVVIRQSWDRPQVTPPEGYFLTGRIWDDDELARVLPPGEGQAQFSLPKQVPSAPFSPSGMQHTIHLRDWLGHEIGLLQFTNENEQLKILGQRSDRIFRTLLVGAVALFVILLLLLESAVVHPLRRVIKSLHTEDISLLEPLRRQDAEFGELARLIRLFFEQRAKLVREMDERSAAEQALHQSEEMLRHSQKMEAVGRLAGGVAHDFNNLLTAIIGYAALLRQRFAHNPAACQPAELIHQAGEQAAGLTRQLLAFSRKQLLQPKVIDLNTIIANLHRLLQRIIGEHIEIVAQPDAAHSCVKADPGQIEQVIVNLGVNARDAMPRGGRLTICTRNVVVDAAQPVADLPPGEYVTLEVTDTGEGMDAETKTRIFEPFFTTKGPGQGTGLGLATVYGIVKQSHGSIVVESERGQGSVFRIYLPKEDGPVETIAPVPVPARTATREECILVVEDEEIVRVLVCEILQSHGYRVLATDRGSDAVRLVQEEKRAIDLLISDVVMPEMNGVVVAQRIHEICPHARVLFVSGYSENDMADQGLEVLDFQVLQKPFTPEVLVRKVREILDHTESANRPESTVTGASVGG